MSHPLTSAPSRPVDTQSVATERVTVPRVRLSSVGWLAHTALTLDEWRTSGARLGAAGRSSNWWIGDWVRYGLGRYGQRYELASGITGYDCQTLMNFAYVSSRFDISRRRETLSWSHHAELAALEQDDQEQWLDRAVLEGLSVRDLRARVRPHARAHLPLATSSTGPVTAPAVAPTGLSCPHCGFVFRVATQSVAERRPLGARESPAPLLDGLQVGRRDEADA